MGKKKKLFAEEILKLCFYSHTGNFLIFTKAMMTKNACTEVNSKNLSTLQHQILMK